VKVPDVAGVVVQAADGVEEAHGVLPAGSLADATGIPISCDTRKGWA